MTPQPFQLCQRQIIIRKVATLIQFVCSLRFPTGHGLKKRCEFTSVWSNGQKSIRGAGELVPRSPA